MLVTNQTSQDYWFGPLHLGAGDGTTQAQQSGDALVPPENTRPVSGGAGGRAHPTRALASIGRREQGPWEIAEEVAEFFNDPSSLPSRYGGSQRTQVIFYSLVRRFWTAPVNPTYAQTSEMFHLWDSVPSQSAAKVLLERGFAIQKDLQTATGPRRQRLLGALSSLAMVLAIRTNFDVVGYFGAEGGTTR